MTFKDVTFTSGLTTFRPATGDYTYAMSVAYPATVASGDLLVMYILGTTATPGPDTSVFSWTQDANVFPRSFVVNTSHYRIANGTEGGQTNIVKVAPVGRAVPSQYIVAIARYRLENINGRPGESPWTEADTQNTSQGATPGSQLPNQTSTLTPIYYPTIATSLASALLAFSYSYSRSTDSLSYHGHVPLDSATLTNCTERGRATISLTDGSIPAADDDMTLIVADKLAYASTQPDATCAFVWTNTQSDSATTGGFKGVWGHIPDPIVVDAGAGPGTGPLRHFTPKELPYQLRSTAYRNFEEDFRETGWIPRGKDQTSPRT